jgi:hypothetical protein
MAAYRIGEDRVRGFAALRDFCRANRRFGSWAAFPAGRTGAISVCTSFNNGQRLTNRRPRWGNPTRANGERNNVDVSLLLRYPRAYAGIGRCTRA